MGHEADYCVGGEGGAGEVGCGWVGGLRGGRIGAEEGAGGGEEGLVREGSGVVEGW